MFLWFNKEILVKANKEPLVDLGPCSLLAELLDDLFDKENSLLSGHDCTCCALNKKYSVRGVPCKFLVGPRKWNRSSPQQGITWNPSNKEILVEPAWILVGSLADEVLL